MRLQKTNFNLGFNTPNVKTLAATYEVNRGEAIGINFNTPLNMFLTTAQTFTATAAAMDVVLDHPLAINELPLNGRRAIVLMGNGNRAVATDYDPATQELSITGLTIDQVVAIYYMPQSGFFELVAIAPGTGVQERTIYNNDFAYLHAINQYKSSSSPRIQTKLLLPQNFTIGLYLTTPWAVVWDRENSIINLEVEKKSMTTVRANAEQMGVKSDRELFNMVIADWMV